MIAEIDVELLPIQETNEDVTTAQTITEDIVETIMTEEIETDTEEIGGMIVEETIDLIVNALMNQKHQNSKFRVHHQVRLGMMMIGKSTGEIEGTYHFFIVLVLMKIIYID